jgi:phosphate transport system permease protein
MLYEPASEGSNLNFPPESLKHNPRSLRTLFGLIMTGIAGLFMLLAIVPLVIILSYLLVKGISAINWQVLTQLPPPPLVEGGGFGNAIVGTAIMVGIGAAISVPIGVMAAIYLSEFSGGKIAEWTRFATNVLSGVPSIIVGVFAYGVIVLTFKSFSAWAGGFALAILMLPIIVRTTDEALKLVPQEIRQASVGIGANNYQTVLQVVLPAAMPAIVTGVTLSVARAAGESAPLIFTALFTQFWPNWKNLLMEPTASLSVLVFNFAIVPFQNQQQLAWAASFILVLLVLLTSIIARLATSMRKY